MRDAYILGLNNRKEQNMTVNEDEYSMMSEDVSAMIFYMVTKMNCGFHHCGRDILSFCYDSGIKTGLKHPTEGIDFCIHETARILSFDAIPDMERD